MSISTAFILPHHHHHRQYCSIDSFKMFKKASHLNFGTANLSIVHGNQNVNTYYLQHAHQVPGPGEEEWKVKLYREYDRIPAGRIKILETLTENEVWREKYEDDSVNVSWDERWVGLRAKRTAHLACLVQGVKESSPFLSITYTGPDAQNVFKQDCLTYSRNRYGNFVQLRGFNDSDIPMVLFHEELIPVQHIQRRQKSSAALQCYLTLQASIAKKNLPEWCPTEWESYDCDNVWIQPRNGRISFGPQGPEPDYFHVDADSEWQLESCSDVPVLHPATYSADCITEYLIKYCPDHIFLDVLAFSGTPSCMYPKIEDCPRHTRQVWALSTSGRPLARFRSGWTSVIGYTWLTEKNYHPITMEDGRRRFSINSTTRLRQGEFLCGFTYRVDMSWRQQAFAWLSQACSIFSTLNIPKHEWSGYELMYSIDLDLHLEFSDYEVEDDFDSAPTVVDNHQTDDCYLFFHPPPHFPDGFPDIHAWRKDFYYYSLDPDGKSVMTEYQRLSFRLPSIVPSVSVYARSYDTDTYNLISTWQEKKGFDPTTTDFARSLGYPSMEVMYSDMDDQRFDDLTEDTDSPSYTDSMVTGDDGAMNVASPTPYSHLQPGTTSSVFEDVEMMADVTLSTDTDMEVD
ncbi:hypothetical protein E1B28_012024 [Marasmius oreades]|uniref:Uncharacterized protein n=1 Tax=Marasmius oreades TaxID=181124 RepID=A0A9P7RRH5_9AGAR|nr:uncharacterized protein E1B28_012024 [Marasmius oreades]KAG7087985.1 hypothetical protein E1B28_012024 [Marasmius oreades]